MSQHKRSFTERVFGQDGTSVALLFLLYTLQVNITVLAFFSVGLQRVASTWVSVFGTGGRARSSVLRSWHLQPGRYAYTVPYYTWSPTYMLAKKQEHARCYGYLSPRLADSSPTGLYLLRDASLDARASPGRCLRPALCTRRCLCLFNFVAFAEPAEKAFDTGIDKFQFRRNSSIPAPTVGSFCRRFICFLGFLFHVATTLQSSR